MKHRRNIRAFAGRLLCDKRALNRKLLCLRRSFQEVYCFLNPGCRRTPKERGGPSCRFL